MKRFGNIVLMLSLLTTPVLRAATYLTIENKQGEQTSFSLEQKPTLSFSSESIILKYGDNEVQYPLSDYWKFTYTDEDVTGITHPEWDNTFILKDNNGIASVAPGTIVQIFNANGTLVSQTVADDNGHVSLYFPTSGLYIVRAGNKYFKYLNKE